jgi:hypothetical protein
VKSVLADAIRLNPQSAAVLLPNEAKYSDFLQPASPLAPGAEAPNTRTDIHLSFPQEGGGTLHLVCDFTVAHPDGSSCSITLPDGTRRTLSEASTPCVASTVATRHKFDKLNKDFILASGRNFTVTVGAMESAGRCDKNFTAYASLALKQICGVVSGASHKGHFSPTFRYTIHLNKLIEATVVAVVKHSLRVMQAVTANYNPKMHDPTLSRGTAPLTKPNNKGRVQTSSSLPAPRGRTLPPSGAPARLVDATTSLHSPPPTLQHRPPSPPLEMDEAAYEIAIADLEEDMARLRRKGDAILSQLESQDSGATPEVSLSGASLAHALDSPSLSPTAVEPTPAPARASTTSVGIG